ncbi:MAG: hypothetical protein GF418_09775 [Chitinivibrionales bacterium]|nr:hypothetical protein [Chitinivibrionales bacterium]MBD3395899.1 hypothetical protein [Chitinivibrionales bacterium]
MPLKKAEYDNFIYIAYVKEGYIDSTAFGRELEKSAELIGSSKDVMVDFTGCTDLGSPEMRSLVRLIQTLQHLQRKVHVVAPPPLKELLTSVNLNRLPYMTISESRDEAITKITEIGAQDS